MPDIYLLIEGKQEGPYTEEATRQSLAEGLIPPNLPAWHEGLEDWVQVGTLMPVDKPELPSLVVDSSASSTRDIRWKSRLMWIALSTLVFFGILGWLFTHRTVQVASSVPEPIITPQSAPALPTPPKPVELKAEPLPDPLHGAKTAAEVAAILFSDIMTDSPIPEPTEAQPGNRGVAEGMLNPGFGGDKAALDQSIELLFKNDVLGTGKADVQINNLSDPFPFFRRILYVNEAPDVAVFTVNTSKDYYCLGIVILGKATNLSRLKSLMDNYASVAGSVMGDDSISNGLISWFKDANFETPYRATANGKKILFFGEVIKNSPTADLMFTGTIQMDN